jgi:RimJ/RimL family protein N-acetyltransferase
VDFTTPAELAGDSVLLRPLRPDDAPAFAGAFAEDPQLGAWVGFEEDPDEDWFRESLDGEERSGFQLAVTAGGSDTLLGIVIVHHVEAEQGRAEVGFWLARDARGVGLGSRALTLLVDWLFGHPWLRRLELTTTPDNAGALALAESLGFTREGVLRQRVVERGRAVDIVWFGLLRDEWPPTSERDRAGSRAEHVPKLHQTGPP